jgi:hypothetical protein
LIELLGMGAIGAFDGAIEFGGTWRQYYRHRPGRPAPKPRTAWVSARHRDEAAERDAIRELRCAAVPPAGPAAGVD